jgi:hypothetical protein
MPATDPHNGSFPLAGVGVSDTGDRPTQRVFPLGGRWRKGQTRFLGLSHSSVAQSSRRRCGNRITSRMFGESVISIIKRSMPMPQPPAGGMPYSSARM